MTRIFHRQILGALVCFGLLLTASTVSAQSTPEEGAARMTVAVTKVEATGKVDPMLAETLKEGLKSEVRQQDKNLKLILKGGDIALSDILLLNDCEHEDLRCLDKVADFLDGAQSFAHARIRRIPNGYGVEMYWYVKGKGDAGKLYERVITEEVIGDGLKFENSVPKLAFRLFGGDTGKLTISANEDGAEIFLSGGEFGPIDSNGKLVGLTPFKDEALLVGTYKLTVKKQAFKTVTREVKVSSGPDGTNEEIFLETNIIGRGPISEALVISGWSITGTGGAFLLASLVTGVMTQQTQNDFDSKLISGTVTSVQVINEARDLKETGHTLSETTNVLLGVGGGLLVVGATLLVLGYSEIFDGPSLEANTDEESTSFNLFFDPQQGSASAVVGWTF